MGHAKASTRKVLNFRLWNNLKLSHWQSRHEPRVDYQSRARIRRLEGLNHRLELDL